MAGGSRRWWRAACGLLLVAALGACQIDIDLVTTVNRDGSGRVSLTFTVDRELVDLARNSGEDPFQAIDQLVDDFEGAGWTVKRSALGGGVQATAERSFEDPSELRLALQEVQQRAAGSGDASTFFSLALERSSGFLRTATAIGGEIDLSLDRVLGGTNLSAQSRNTLQTLIDQASNEFFFFRVRARLPGKVKTATGDPEQVEGGTVEWRPRLGRTLTFRAETSAYNAGSLAAVGAPAVLVIVLGGWLLIRRRRRSRRMGPD